MELSKGRANLKKIAQHNAQEKDKGVVATTKGKTWPTENEFSTCG